MFKNITFWRIPNNSKQFPKLNIIKHQNNILFFSLQLENVYGIQGILGVPIIHQD